MKTMTYPNNNRSNNNNYPRPQASEQDDEENEEIMRANAKLATHSIHQYGNESPRNPKFDNSKSAADNWKGIGNRHMASQVGLEP